MSISRDIMNVQLSVESTQQEPLVWLDNFIQVYSQLSVDNLALLDKVYHEDILFTDPMHSVQGFDQLKKYFNSLYTNLESCSFNIVQVIHEGNQAAIYWKMTFVHPKLSNGCEIEVLGNSQLQGCEEKVIYQRDFFDLGAMLYQHLPLVGRLIGFIKNRAASYV
ncbi:MAG: nuclear transport factor 2 family protein [Litorilituus sp.]|jgi:hypothetical protein|nr:nuclear transport factor 2 family protein [Litorilituus sp.]